LRGSTEWPLSKYIAYSWDTKKSIEGGDSLDSEKDQLEAVALTGKIGGIGAGSDKQGQSRLDKKTAGGGK